MMFVSLFEIIYKNSFYACQSFEEIRSFPPLKRCIARDSVPRLVFGNHPDEVVSALGINRPSRPEAEIFDVPNPI